MTRLPITAGCDGGHLAAHDSGSRTPAAIKWVVFHSTEGPTAAGAASWFENPASEGSAQIVVDDDGCYRCLIDMLIPWAAPGANTNGLHLEQAGYTVWTRSQWLAHDDELSRAAYKAAVWAHLYGIPLRWVGPLGLRLGRKGFTTHRDISYAWPLQARAAGFHTDPGRGYPKDVVLGRARAYLTELERKTT